jgi:hypothetical protein
MFDARVVTSFISHPSWSPHRLRSSLEPLNSSANTCVHEPPGPTGPLPPPEVAAFVAIVVAAVVGGFGELVGADFGVGAVALFRGGGVVAGVGAGDFGALAVVLGAGTVEDGAGFTGASVIRVG